MAEGYNMDTKTLPFHETKDQRLARARRLLLQKLPSQPAPNFRARLGRWQEWNQPREKPASWVTTPEARRIHSRNWKL